MKKIFSILLLCSLLLAWGCTKTCTCTTVKEVVPSDINNPDNPDNPDNPTHTNTELLCNPRGWVLSGAISTPPYIMFNGDLVTNLMTDGYLFDYELDDYIKFLPEGTQIINGGSIVPLSGEPYQAFDHTYNYWSFNADETELNMQIPFFYDDEWETVRILTLSETKLRILYVFNLADGSSKEVYSFTLTYVPRNIKAGTFAKSAQYVSRSESTVKTNGKCSDLNASSTITDFDGTQTIEKTECK